MALYIDYKISKINNKIQVFLKLCPGLNYFSKKVEEKYGILNLLVLTDLYSSQNGFRKNPKTILPEYNCNQDLVFWKDKNQTGFSIHTLTVYE